MIAYVIGASRKSTLKNHIAKFVAGGEAGLFRTWWDRRLRQFLAEQFTTLLHYNKYVDSINILVKTSSGNGNVETEKNILRESSK